MGCKIPFSVLAIAFELLFLILFAVFCDYDPEASGRNPENSERKDGSHPENEISHFYPMFQDVHVMMFIGFGFLMTFLKRYGFSSIGFNMVVAALCLQWASLMDGFLSLITSDGYKFTISIETLITSDFSAACILITMGAVLGKTSPAQLLLIAFFEIVIFKVNEYIGLHYLQVSDVGGSMFVHAFGAYFGLMLARVIYNRNVEDSKEEGSCYHSDLFSMIGTIFLWMYWPSFNAALAPGDRQHRAVINTYLSLAACCVTAFGVSSMLHPHRKFDMVHVQNATLAGGVAVGTSADMMIHPAGAIGIGILSGTLSVIGFRYIQGLLTSKLSIHDTCGVNNLHGMPGIFAGLVGAIMAGVASEADYSYSLYEVFPARVPPNGTAEFEAIKAHLGKDLEPGSGRSAGEQAGYQLAALAMTLAVSSVGGALTGLVLRLLCVEEPEEPFIDDLFWEVPEIQTEPEEKHAQVEIVHGYHLKEAERDGNNVDLAQHIQPPEVSGHAWFSEQFGMAD